MSLKIGAFFWRVEIHMLSRLSYPSSPISAPVMGDIATISILKLLHIEQYYIELWEHYEKNMILAQQFN